MSIKTACRAAAIRSHAHWSARAPEDAVVLSCEPRGGSSWIGELLAAEPESATIWEPLSLDNVPDVKALGFGWRQHIPAAADWPEARALMARILSGQVINGWTASESPIRNFLSAERLVVKFCRANALLPWLARQFHFRRKPVYVLRHPIAIASSQVRMGKFAPADITSKLTKGRFGETYAEHVDYLRSLRSVPARLVAQWSLTNRWPLSDPDADELWTRVHYEDLLTDPRGEIARIYAAWDMSPPAEAEARVSVASRTTRDGALRLDPEAQISKWHEDFTDAELAEMLAVLRHFGITVYGEAAHPIAEAAARPAQVH